MTPASAAPSPGFSPRRVAAMVLLTVRLDLITGLILFPYLVWLSVAAALNFSILRNNR